MSSIKDILVVNKKLIALGAVAVGVALAAKATRGPDAELVDVVEDVVTPNGKVDTK